MRNKSLFNRLKRLERKADDQFPDKHAKLYEAYREALNAYLGNEPLTAEQEELLHSKTVEKKLAEDTADDGFVEALLGEDWETEYKSYAEALKHNIAETWADHTD